MRGLVKALWQGLRVESPTKTLFEGEKATLAVLIFLRGSKVGEVVSLVALGRGRGVEDLVGQEGEEGAGLPMHENVLYLMVCWQKIPSFKALGPINRAAVPFLGSFLSRIFRTFPLAR